MSVNTKYFALTSHKSGKFGPIRDCVGGRSFNSSNMLASILMLYDIGMLL
jgi:hypothetical protein